MVRQLLPIVALLASCAFLLAGGGVHGILIPVRGELAGFSSTQLGFIGAGSAIGFTIGCIIVPRIVRRVGHVRTFGSLAALLATTLLMSGLYIEAFTWVILRAVSGFCLSGAYMIIESWLNEQVNNENRGAVFSVYMITSQVAMMVGQYMLVVADPQTETLFMMGAILYALAVLPTALSKAQSPAPLTEASFDLKKLYLNSPAAAIGGAMQGIISGAWLSFAPVYGSQLGMSYTNIANIVVFAMIGSIIFQYPLGRLSDKIDRRFVIIGSGLCGAVLGLLIGSFVQVGAEPGLWFFILMLAFGGFIYPIYGIIVAHANDHAAPVDFVQIASSLLILYGLGTMVGPLLVAQVMEALGPNGLFTFMGISHLILAAYVAWRVMRRPAPMEEDTVDIPAMIAPLTRTPESYALDPRSDAEYYENQDQIEQNSPEQISVRNEPKETP